MHQRARDVDPLLHAARKLVRVMVHELPETEFLQQSARREHFGAAADFQRQLDVAQRRARRDQGRPLKGDADLLPPPRFQRRGAPDRDRSGGQRFQSRQQAQQRGLAATRRAEQGNEFALRHLQGDAVEHLHGTEAFAHPLDLHGGTKADGFGSQGDTHRSRPPKRAGGRFRPEKKRMFLRKKPTLATHCPLAIRRALRARRCNLSRRGPLGKPRF